MPRHSRHRRDDAPPQDDNALRDIATIWGMFGPQADANLQLTQAQTSELGQRTHGVKGESELAHARALAIQQEMEQNKEARPLLNQQLLEAIRGMRGDNTTKEQLRNPQVRGAEAAATGAEQGNQDRGARAPVELDILRSNLARQQFEQKASEDRAPYELAKVVQDNIGQGIANSTNQLNQPNLIQHGAAQASQAQTEADFAGRKAQAALDASKIGNMPAVVNSMLMGQTNPAVGAYVNEQNIHGAQIKPPEPSPAEKALLARLQAETTAKATGKEVNTTAPNIRQGGVFQPSEKQLNNRKAFNDSVTGIIGHPIDAAWNFMFGTPTTNPNYIDPNKK